MPKQSNRTGPTHVTRKKGGDHSGPTMGSGPGFGGTKCIPYSGYDSGGTAVDLKGSMKGWYHGRQHPRSGPMQSERRSVTKKH